MLFNLPAPQSKPPTSIQLQPLPVLHPRENLQLPTNSPACRHLRRSRPHLLVEVLLEEREQQAEAVLNRDAAVALLQPFPRGRLLRVVHPHVQRLVLEADAREVLHLWQYSRAIHQGSTPGQSSGQYTGLFLMQVRARPSTCCSTSGQYIRAERQGSTSGQCTRGVFEAGVR